MRASREVGGGPIKVNAVVLVMIGAAQIGRSALGEPAAHPLSRLVRFASWGLPHAAPGEGRHQWTEHDEPERKPPPEASRCAKYRRPDEPGTDPYDEPYCDRAKNRVVDEPLVSSFPTHGP